MKTLQFIVAAVTSPVYIFVTAHPARAQTTQWVRIPTDPANTPPGREETAMVYDEQRERIVLHGGLSQSLQTLNDTWEWDGESWTKLETGPNDPRLVLFSMVYDRQRE